MKKVLVLGLVLLALFLVGCTEVPIDREQYCIERGFDTYTEYSVGNDTDFLCCNESNIGPTRTLACPGK